MKFRWDNRYLHWGVTAFLVIAASMLFYYGIFHMKTLIVGIKTFLGIMAPIIYGVILAYILSPLINLFEQKLIYPQLEKHNIKLQKKGKRAIRWGCVLFSMFLFWIIIYALLMMVLPQLIRSIMSIIYSFPYYIKVIEKWLNSFVEHGWKLNPEMLDMINQYSVKAQEYLTTDILPQMQDMLKNVSAGIFDILIFMKNFLIGAIVALYVLADKEKFVAKSKMMVYAILPHKWANMLIRVMRFTDKTFGGFIYGKLLDSAIIGILCYFGMLLLDLPYPILISVIIGVTNVIPFFGPYIGAIPCILLILVVDPIKGLYFAIFILLLQQFDALHYLYKRRFPLFVLAVFIVELLRAVDGDTHQPVVFAEELTPFIRQHGAVGLDAVVDGTSPGMFFLQLHRFLVERQGAHQGFSTVPGEHHLRHGLRIDVFFDKLFQQLFAHHVLGVVLI